MEDKLAKDVQMQLDNARHKDTGCAAAGYTGCCTGDDCKTESGCYCDVRPCESALFLSVLCLCLQVLLFWFC